MSFPIVKDTQEVLRTSSEGMEVEMGMTKAVSRGVYRWARFWCEAPGSGCFSGSLFGYEDHEASTPLRVSRVQSSLVSSPNMLISS
jgi:hypothetical protein